MEQNVNVIKVSEMNEVQVLNLMKNVSECLIQAEVNLDFDTDDRRHEVVSEVTESLSKAIEALAKLYAMEVATNARVKADILKDDAMEQAKKK